MKTTVWGTAKQLGELVAVRSASGQVAGAYAVDDLEPCLAGNSIDLGHDPTKIVGSIVYAEIGREGQVGIVGVVDDLDFEQVDEPVYFSGSYAPKDERNLQTRSFVVPSAWLTGVSLTLEPATGAAAWPIHWRTGDVRDVADRGGWPLSWPSEAPLLRNAVDYLGTDWQVRTRTAMHLVDRRSDAGSDYPWQMLPAQGWRSPDGRDRQKPAGRLRYGPPGRVISVR